MRSLLAIYILAASAAVAPVRAQDSDWTYSPFTSQTVEMAVATNKKTGAKMHVMRTHSGLVMAIVPVNPLLELMKETPDNMLQ